MPVRAAFFVAVIVMGCAPPETLSQADSEAVASEVVGILREAYDLSKPRLSERMLSLYPDSGAVISASAGRVQASRDSLEMGIRYFWDNVGVNMRDARWVWDTSHVTVLSRHSAVITATYHIPHRNPRNEPHVLGGAMTAVFQKRGGRWVIVQEHLSDWAQTSGSQATNQSHENH